MRLIADTAKVCGRQFSCTARPEPSASPRSAMVTSKVTGIAVGNIDNRRRNALAMTFRDLYDLLVHLWLFTLEFFALRLLEFIKGHLITPNYSAIGCSRGGINITNFN